MSGGIFHHSGLSESRKGPRRPKGLGASAQNQLQSLNSECFRTSESSPKSGKRGNSAVFTTQYIKKNRK